jgi:hypothetical protein
VKKDKYLVHRRKDFRKRCHALTKRRKSAGEQNPTPLRPGIDHFLKAVDAGLNAIGDWTKIIRYCYICMDADLLLHCNRAAVSRMEC